MTVDVLVYPHALGNQVFQDKTVVVIDAFRATSTIVTALANQALEVIPVNEPLEALELLRNIGREECVTGGEQKGFKIEGFDLGNSPLEYTTDRIAGKKVILCTTNGTKAIKRAQGAAQVLIGCFLNLEAVIANLTASIQDVLIVCAGREQNVSLEDLVCAGMIVRGLKQANPLVELTDAAMMGSLTAGQALDDLPSFLKSGEHGRYLIDNNMAEDIEACVALNRYDIVPRYADGKIVVAKSLVGQIG